MQEAGGDGQMTPLLRLTAGAVAGIIGMSATYPLDMVRGRLTVQTDKQYRGILHATRLIIKQVSRASALQRACSKRRTVHVNNGHQNDVV
jgi:Mitochondrial carrier protein